MPPSHPLWFPRIVRYHQTLPQYALHCYKCLYSAQNKKLDTLHSILRLMYSTAQKKTATVHIPSTHADHCPGSGRRGWHLVEVVHLFLSAHLQDVSSPGPAFAQWYHCTCFGGVFNKTMSTDQSVFLSDNEEIILNSNNNNTGNLIKSLPCGSRHCKVQRTYIHNKRGIFVALYIITKSVNINTREIVQM